MTLLNGNRLPPESQPKAERLSRLDPTVERVFGEIASRLLDTREQETLDQTLGGIVARIDELFTLSQPEHSVDGRQETVYIAATGSRGAGQGGSYYQDAVLRTNWGNGRRISYRRVMHNDTAATVETMEIAASPVESGESLRITNLSIETRSTLGDGTHVANKRSRTQDELYAPEGPVAESARNVDALLAGALSAIASGQPPSNDRFAIPVYVE